jgi:secreted PhoX family phosphatase
VRPDIAASPPISEQAQRRLARRTVLAGGLATATASFFTAATPSEAAAATEARRGPQPAVPVGDGRSSGSRRSGRVSPTRLCYRPKPLPGALPVGPPDRAVRARVRRGCQQQRGGAGQAGGDQHVGMWFFPLSGGRSGLLCVNHEATAEQLLHTDATGDQHQMEDGRSASPARRASSSCRRDTDDRRRGRLDAQRRKRGRRNLGGKSRRSGSDSTAVGTCWQATPKTAFRGRVVGLPPGPGAMGG